MKKNFFSLMISTLAACSALISNVEAKIYIYDTASRYCETVKAALSGASISYELVNHLDGNDDENLYIIFDVHTLKDVKFPAHYITYQTLDLTKNPLTVDYKNKLLNSVTVWDYSLENIERYNSVIHNYFYLPKDYEYVDPVILVCKLPVSALSDYKSMVIYSNYQNTDISSHLPTLFYYTVTQHPQLIIEAGVRGGESTIPFSKAMGRTNASLIGIDIDPGCESCYKDVPNSVFLCMDDLNFETYYKKSPYREMQPDIIFIDTSHLYEQTIKKIALFAPLLKKNGILMFHDSNVTPLNNNYSYVRLNNTMGHAGGNTRGVTQGIKEYFNISFNEHTYCCFNCNKDGQEWNVTHYPFCNGMTVIRKI